MPRVSRTVSLATHLTKTLDSYELDDVNMALVSLARRYAVLIDRAEATAKEFDDLDFSGVKVTAAMYKRLEKIEAKIRAESVLNDLGPKYLAVLTALGMTASLPKATRKEGSNEHVDAPADELAALRRERAGVA